MARASKSKQTKTSAASAESDVLEKTKKRFTDSWDYAKANWHKKWERDNKLYDNERYKQNYQGITDTFVPMVFPTVETMVTALSNASLRFDFKSNNPLHTSSAAPLNALIDEWWNEYQWDIAIEEGSREMIKTGMGGFMWSWEIDHPCLDWFAMRDAILDPTVKRPADLQQPGAYAGRRYFIRKGQLDEYEVVDTDPKSKTYGEMVKRYKTAKVDVGSVTKDDDKAIKEMFDGSTLGDADKQQDEIIEIWDVDRVVTLQNRKHVIEDVENPYKVRHEAKLFDEYYQEALNNDLDEEQAIQEAQIKAKSEAKGVVPFFFFRNYRSISLFYAKGEVDSIAKEQERLNDLTNMEGDYIMKQIAGQRELDPTYEDWLDLINEDPGNTYPFKPGSLQAIPVPILPSNAFTNRTEAKNTIREATAVDQIAKGGSADPGTTATEIIEQKASTGERIESKARILEKDGLFWMAWILFKLVQLYMDKPVVVEITGINSDEEGAPVVNGIQLPKNTAVFNPDDYKGDDWRPSISLELDSMNKRRQDRANARAEYQLLIQDPTNNLQELKKRYYPKMFDMDKADLDAIITQAQNSPMGMGMPGAMPPTPTAPTPEPGMAEPAAPEVAV